MADGWGWPFDSGEGSFLGGQKFGTHPGGEFRPNGFHNGLDFGNIDHPGNPLKAVHAGEVIYTGVPGGDLSELRAVIVIKHDDLSVIYQEFSYSASDILVNVGDKVKLGQAIGTRTTEHLHLGMTKKDWRAAQSSAYSDDGTFLDPYKIIKEGYTGGGGDGDGDGDDDGGESKSRVRALRINSFVNPLVKEKTIQKGNEDVPKYHLIRSLLNDRLSGFYPSAILYINGLQGEYGLEKLCVAPFSNLTLTNGKGVQKNFNLTNFKAQEEPFKVAFKGYLGKGNRVEFYCKDYLHYVHETATSGQEEAAIRKDSLMDTTNKDFDFVVDASATYEYMNQHRIKQSHDNAKLAMSNNQIQNDNSTRNFRLDQERQNNVNQITQTGQRSQLDLAHQKQWAQWGIGNIGNAVGIATNVMTGNVGGALGGAANMMLGGVGLGMGQSYEQQALSMAQGTANQALAANQGTNKEIFMNNISTSQVIASNNYDNAVANINAGLADIKNQPDVSVVTGADYNFEMGWDNDDIYSIIYTTHPQALIQIAEYFAQFGYAINRYDYVHNYLRVRTSFNYIKTKGANIKGDISNKWRNNLNMIFDNGVTFWQDKEKMADGDITGNYWFGTDDRDY